MEKLPIRVKSGRYPYRRAGVIIAAPRQWQDVELDQSIEGSKQLLELLKDKALVVEIFSATADAFVPAALEEQAAFEAAIAASVDPELLEGDEDAGYNALLIRTVMLEARLSIVESGLSRLLASTSHRMPTAGPTMEREDDGLSDEEAVALVKAFTGNSDTQLPTAKPTFERDASEIAPQAKTTPNVSDPGKVAEEFTPPPPPVVPAIPSSTSATVPAGDPEPATAVVQESAPAAKTEPKPNAKATPKPKH